MKNMLELADRYRELRAEKDALNARSKAVNADIEKVEAELVEAMLNEEMQKFDRNGQLFYLSTRTYASPVAQRAEELHRWLKNNGYEDLVKETVNANTLSAFVREQLKEAEQLPPALAELLNVYEKTGVSLRKS